MLETQPTPKETQWSSMEFHAITHARAGMRNQKKNFKQDTTQ